MNLFNLFKKEQIPEEYKNINAFLQYVKKNGKVPFKTAPEVLKALLEIANTPKWYEHLDKGAIEGLEQLFNKWQLYMNTTKQKELQKVGKKGGAFENKSYGRYDDYEDEEDDENVIWYNHDYETGEFNLYEK